MADTPISGLPGAVALTGVEKIPAVQSAADVSLTPAQLAAYLQALFLQLAGGTLTGPLVLPGNATLALQAVPFQQLTAVVAAGVAGITYPVTSVNGHVGAAVVTASDVGLGSVNNTSDAAKPISTLQAAAFALCATLAGANVFTNQQSVTPYRANISGVVSIDLAATAKSNVLILTLTGNVTSFALTNPADGATYNIWLIQDATGGRTFSGFPAAFKFTMGTAPTWTTTANAIDFVSATYGATESKYMASQLPNMS